MKVKLVESFDSNGNELSSSQEAFFKRSKVRNAFGDILVVYRGTVAQINRNEFSGNAKGFTSNIDYADKYKISDKDTVYSCYLNCTNIFDCGNTDGRVFKLDPRKLSITEDFEHILHKLNLTEQLFVTKFKKELQDIEAYKGHIYTIVRTDKFIDLVRRSGYDCIHTIEEGDNDCYGVLYNRCIKLTSNTNPTNSDNINESLTEDVERMPADFKPEKIGKAYKVFYEKDGKLYPPMVANKGGADTPIGVGLKAQVADMGKPSKTGRPQVKGGGKGTKSGKLSLAFRPGGHLGDIPLAKQFLKKDGTGPKDLVGAECDYAMDIDYQDEADERGYGRTKVDDEGNVSEYRSDKYQHSLAGLKKIPENGYYKYRTNPNPDTVPGVITGAMKVNRILSNNEVEEILKKAGIQAPKIEEQLDETLRRIEKDVFVTYNIKDVIDRLKENEHDGRLLYDDHEKMGLMGNANEIIHYDLIDAAGDNGYYDDQMDFILDNMGSSPVNYRDYGEDGFYINEGEKDEECVDPWIYSLIYATPDSTELEYYDIDGFKHNKKTSLGGTLFGRDIYALEETPLESICI